MKFVLVIIAFILILLSYSIGYQKGWGEGAKYTQILIKSRESLYDNIANKYLTDSCYQKDLEQINVKYKKSKAKKNK